MANNSNKHFSSEDINGEHEEMPSITTKSRPQCNTTYTTEMTTVIKKWT
jgi:hypothetical protein